MSLEPTLASKWQFKTPAVKVKGPFDLKGLSRVVAFIAVAWIITITVVFVLPTANPVTSQTLNYTVVAVGIIAIGATTAWVLWARKWFTGPATEVTEALRLGVDLTEPRVEEINEKAAKATGVAPDSSD